MKKSASAVSVIGGADGPTSIFFKKNAKLTLKQKIQRAKNKIKRFYVDKTLSCESHSLDEVIEYIVNRYRFAEVDKDAEEFPEEYQQMRASFIIQYAPELLGESTACPKLKSESPKDVEAYIRQSEERMVTVHRQAFSELKMPYDTVVAADFADLECEASAKSVTGTRYE